MRICQLVPLLWGAFAVGPACSGDLPAIAKNSIFAVRAYHASQVAEGSAVRLGSDTFVTNCHVTGAARRVDIIRNGRTLPARVNGMATARDLCLLRAAHSDGEPVPRGNLSREGQIVYAIGFPAHKDLTVSRGKVIALHAHDGSHVIQVSAAFDYGSSGGGLFDEQGRLVGILAFKARAGGDFHFALPTAWVEDTTSGIATGAPDERPFWQAEHRNLPYFLRAVSLEASGKWQRLADLGRHWTVEDPLNSGAWRALEKARTRLGAQAEGANFITAM